MTHIGTPVPTIICCGSVTGFVIHATGRAELEDGLKRENQSGAGNSLGGVDQVPHNGQKSNLLGSAHQWSQSTYSWYCGVRIEAA